MSSLLIIVVFDIIVCLIEFLSGGIKP
jgi:hypothetical protein